MNMKRKYLSFRCWALANALLLFIGWPSQSFAAQPDTGWTAGETACQAVRIVVPRYSAHDLPDLKAAATSGNALRIEVRIDVAGVVAKATALSGPEKLKKLALGAASQWRFPALPVESAKAERIGLIVFSFIPSTDWVWIVTGGQEHSHSLPAAPLEKSGQLPKPKDQGVIEQQQHGQNRCQEADISNARAQGSVEVQVLISEQGDVLAARAISGHPLLHAASVEAALKWKFKPTLQSGVPVKVAGILTFNYKLQPDGKPDMTRQ